MSLTITHYAAVPFDLGGRPRTFPGAYVTNTGCDVHYPEQAAAVILGNSWVQLVDSGKPPGTAIYLNGYGFGVMICQVGEHVGSLDDTMIAKVLLARRSLHDAIATGVCKLQFKFNTFLQ